MSWNSIHVSRYHVDGPGMAAENLGLSFSMCEVLASGHVKVLLKSYERPERTVGA